MNGKVNSASGFLGNLVENVKFRLVGVPPDVAGQLIDIDLEKDNIFLVFQNKNNKKFISAWVDEEGFATEELENL